ncbi:Uncharacterised protein [Legionella sainthelensi]|uniref:hypothetical protein n=1 Tax=Legionella sainthelensi TaxID=28087 RepID=UPI000E2089A5|nr:hypothetical protein [Legionella sainthelensi]VEB35741.1 Uncharacterised protein [Legionella sainthelensi]
MEKNGLIHICPLESEHFFIPKIIDELCQFQIEKNINDSLSQQVPESVNSNNVPQIRKDRTVPPEETTYTKEEYVLDANNIKLE